MPHSLNHNRKGITFMSKLSLKIIVISFLISPFNIQSGWCMNEVKEDLDSATRKAIRIQTSTIKHSFEEEPIILAVPLDGVLKIPVNPICKNCGGVKSNCYGFGGGVEEIIKIKAKELKALLKKMESTMSISEATTYGAMKASKK